MQRFGWVVGLGLLLAVSVAAQGSGAANGPFGFTDFSATMEMTGGGRTVSGGKIYRAGSKMRTDMPQMGANSYILMLLDEHQTFMVMPGGHCMQMPQQRAQAQHPNPFEFRGKIERTPLGTGTVDGHPVKIEQVTVTPEHGEPTTMKVWEATDLHGFPVRVEMATARGPMTMEYKDVSLSPPPASLFTKPENCMSMPGMPGGGPPRR